MLKEYLKQKNLSLYQLSRMSGVPYSTLNDIANNKVEIDNVKAGILFRISDAIGVTMDKLYEVCTHRITIYSAEYSSKGVVNIKNKAYVLAFEYRSRKFLYELCPVKKEATLFIESIALWQMEKLISDYEMELAYELCVKTKR